MKMLGIVMLAATLPFLAFGETPGELYTQGQRAYLSGDLEAAKMKFAAVLESDPGHQGATNYMRMIRAQGKNAAGSAAHERKFATIVIPSVEFKEASLGSALAYLKQKSEELSKGTTVPNFVVNLPAGQVDTKSVTLSVRNIPLPDVLKYLGKLAEVQFTYEPYAILVEPRGAAASSAPAP